MARESRFDPAADKAVAARARVMDMIDVVPPDALVKLVKEKPSLRGMVLGNIAELLFERHLPQHYPEIRPEHIVGHDDHDRSANKSDRTISFRGRSYAIQVKSIQTGSIKEERASGQLCATLQNDGSDMRTVTLKDGSTVATTCYVRGEYDILAVPLFPFTGTDAFAYKRNEDCRATTHRSYTTLQREWLLATTEPICWPLSSDWHTDLLDLLTPGAGSPIGRPDVVTKPRGEIRVSEAGATILPDEDEKI